MPLIPFPFTTLASARGMQSPINEARFNLLPEQPLRGVAGLEVEKGW